MKFESGLGLFGEVTLSVYDVKQGKFQRVFRHTQKNQITNNGREIVLDLLGGGPLSWVAGTDQQTHPEYNWIWSFGVGTDNTPPTLADTSLGAQVYISALSPLEVERAVVANPLWSLEISKTVPSGQATGSIITEAAIFTRGDDDDPTISKLVIAGGKRRMYSRIVHTPVEKSATMALVYDWRLGITIES